MAKKRRAKKREAKPKWPLVLETYSEPRPTTRNILILPEPSAFNGIVNVVRYRVTVEPIDEPKEQKRRLKKLWRECANFHLWHPLRDEAKRLGVELDPDERGTDRER